jgi:hypothetical protein
MIKMDDDTLKWMRADAVEHGHEGVVRDVDAALAGNTIERATRAAFLMLRVGQAHRAHCRRGQASRLEGM